jgi:hypothetical protein
MRMHIASSFGGNDFTEVGKVGTPDLQDNEIGTSEARLEGKRIQVNRSDINLKEFLAYADSLRQSS